MLILSDVFCLIPNKLQGVESQRGYLIPWSSRSDRSPGESPGNPSLQRRGWRFRVGSGSV